MCVSPQLLKEAEHLASETLALARKEAEHLASETLALASKIWRPAPVISESRGRKPKRAKSSRFRSHQGRAFTVGVLHSIQVYKHLREHEYEIRSMLYARGLIDKPALVCATRLGVSGVRPDVHDVENADSASSCWLDKNVYVAGSCRPERALTESGDVRVRLTSDGVATRRGKNGLRVYVALEQLLSWTYFWSNRQQELQGWGWR